METAKHPLQLLLETLDHHVRPYTGRGSSKEVLAVTVAGDPAGLAELVASLVTGAPSLGADALYEVGEALKRMRQDAMGRGTVVYFPGVPFVDDLDEGAVTACVPPDDR